MKRILCLICVLLMILMSVAVADDDAVMSIQTIHISSDGMMHAVTYYSQLGELQPKDFSVMLDDRKIAADQVSYYHSSEMGTSWVYVIDVSMKMEGRRLTKTKTLVNSLIETLGPYDNAAVAPTGTTSLSLTADQPTLKAALNAIEHQDESKNALYAMISTAVRYLKTGKDVKPRTAIVIISNGENNTETGTTLEELKEQVGSAESTIYTIAMCNENRRRNRIADYNSIAQMSCGGYAQEIPYNTQDVSSYAAAISQHEMLFRVIDIPAAKNGWNGQKLSLVTVNQTTQLSTEYALSQADQKAIQNAIEALATPTPTIAPTATPVPTATPEPTLKERLEELSPLQWGILVAVCIAVIALIVLLTVLLKKRKRRLEAEKQEVSAPEVDEPGDIETMPAEERNGPETIQVYLESVGMDESKTYSSPMVNELVIGRSGKLSRLVIQDTKVSSKHCKLMYEDGNMFIEDLGSLNGTIVNSMQIHGRTLLHQQDTITIGKTNLRIFWEKANA